MDARLPTAAEQRQKAIELKNRFFRSNTVNVALDKRNGERQESDAIKTLKLELETAKATIGRRDAAIRRMKQQIIASEQEIECYRETVSVLMELCGGDPKVMPDKLPIQIIRRVLIEKHPHISYEELVSRRRVKRIVEAKYDCAEALFRERPDMSIREIGISLGYADHSGIAHALNKRGLVRGN